MIEDSIQIKTEVVNATCHPLKASYNPFIDGWNLPKIEMVEVKAKPRRLGVRVTHYWRGRKFNTWAPWTIEPVQDLQTMYGLDVESELMRIIREEMVSEFGG